MLEIAARCAPSRQALAWLGFCVALAACGSSSPKTASGRGGSTGSGDGSFYSTGIFFEGALTTGCPDGSAVHDAIEANIVAVGYGK